MYLSKLVLNPRHDQAQRDLAAPYELHRTLGRAFPQATTTHYRQECGVLFRIEPPSPSGAVVLVQSGAEPDWQKLVPGYALRTDGPKPFAPTLQVGQQLRFRLVANPVRRTRREGSDGKSRVHRIPLIHGGPNAAGHPTYWEWLERQGREHGFEVDLARTQDTPVQSGTGPRGTPGSGGNTPGGKRAQVHVGIRFDGVLAVREPAALAAVLRDGFGPAKAYGFGLISLAPAA